jgi:cellulose biosynthesis protein BcsQ
MAHRRMTHRRMTHRQMTHRGGQVMNVGKAIFVGNIKGGVGKSTLAVYLTDYLRRRYQRRPVMLLDTDPQGTAFEMMQPHSRADDIKFLPIGDRYDGVSMTTLDGVLRRMLSYDDAVAIVDTGAGKLGNVWQMAMLCSTVLVPTSMSWTDLRPTIDFIKELDDRKEDYGVVNPHVVVVPNRTSPSQKNFGQLAGALEEVNAIMAPPISDLSVARSHSSDFQGINAVEGTRFCEEIERLGEFIIDYVISGELDRIYQTA